MHNNLFSQIDFGPLMPYLNNDDVTDISYSNNGQVWLKTLSQGIFRIENPLVNNEMMEKLAFQCSNVMGHSFNAAHPFLDSESAELRMNFIHDSIASNGIACVIRKTPAKIRLEKDKIIAEKYITADIHDFLIQCVLGHCNIIVCGETGSGKTEFVKYLASKTKEDEKVITIEDTLELHLDRIFPHRDIVAMKTNNIASYSDVLVTCMRQNPKWILLSEVRSAEAVQAVRNSISSGHYILSTIHADKASSIPNRMYSLLETSQDIDQFLKSIYRYIQLGVLIRGYQDKVTKRFIREVAEVTEFYVTEDNEAKYNVIYKKTTSGKVVRNNPSAYLIDYIEGQGVKIPDGFINPLYDVKSETKDNNVDDIKTTVLKPVYEHQVSQTPVVSTYKAPSIPVYEQPMYQAPVEPVVPIYKAPVEPVYEQPMYQTQNPPAYKQPMYQAPNGQTFDFINQTNE
ncbi:MAG: ATPase, T2SS/T4P/T4SS family [Bacilli bacterium]